MSDDHSHGSGSGGARTQRVDAQRNRDTLIRTAAEFLRRGDPLAMQSVADAAGVSRSTLYRHFGSPEELRVGLQQRAVAAVGAAIDRCLREHKPPLALLRSVASALIDVGAEFPPDAWTGPSARGQLANIGHALQPLAERIAEAADLTPTPPAPWLRDGIAHFVESCLAAGWTGGARRAGAVERLLRTVAEPLDRGLLLLDADGMVVALNEEAQAAVDASDRVEPGGRVIVRNGGLYEDGSPAPTHTHPLNLALASGEAQEAIRASRRGNGRVRWLSIEVHALRHSPPGGLYGFVAVFTDVSHEKRFERSGLRPAGQMRASAAPLLDVVRVLDEVPPYLLPEQLVAEAMRVAEGPVALYVLDIDGSHLLRLAGPDDFPPRLEAPLALGPELAEDGLPDLTAHLAREMPGVAMAPMWLRGRAIGVLLSLRGSEPRLQEVARLGAAAMELAGGYTDVFDAARRRKDMDPAAEIQQSLLPPRIARIGSGQLAGSVLPSYDVGGDWFDYVENRDGAWIAIADAAGKGPQAGGLGGVALAALRAARRNDATLEQAAETMHETVAAVGGPEFYVTAIVARWNSVYSVFSWINCGHPPPLLIRSDDQIEELFAEPDLPLGLFERTTPFHRHQRRLLYGDRLVLYSDGIARRRTADGLFGTDGIARAVRAADARTATQTTRAIQEAVASASEDPLPDDAAVVVLAATSGTEIG